MWIKSNFSLQYLFWIIHEGLKNEGNDHQLKKLLIDNQILLVSTLRNVWWTVWRICILILWCKGLKLLNHALLQMYLEVSPHCKFAPFHLCKFIPWSMWSCSHLFQSALKCFTVFPIAEQFLFCWYLNGRLFKFRYGWNCAFCGLLPRICSHGSDI